MGMQLGLIGKNMQKSLSAKIHNFTMQQFEIPGAYKLYDLEAEQLPKFLEEAWSQGFHGFNVTSPYKSQVAELLHSPYSSVNTLYRGDAGWEACSTDGEGFLRALERLNFARESFEKIVILGSGGVVDALLTALGTSSAQIFCLRRSSLRDPVLKKLCPSLEFKDLSLEILSQLVRGESVSTLVIQATSAPLHGDSLSYLSPALEDFHGVFIDLIYGSTSDLLRKATLRKLPCQDGLPMLIEQACLSQQLWFGKSLDFETLWELLGKESFGELSTDKNGADGRN